MQPPALQNAMHNKSLYQLDFLLFTDMHNLQLNMQSIFLDKNFIFLSSCKISHLHSLQPPYKGIFATVNKNCLAFDPRLFLD